MSTPTSDPQSTPLPRAGGKSCEPHPAGGVKYSNFKQLLRMLALVTYFIVCALSIHATQLIGSPLYFINKDYYYAYMSLTKQSFGIMVTVMTRWWTPTVVRVSGDTSVRGQLRQTQDGRLECDFPERMIFIANHQLYSDWLYLWWIAYTSSMHGHIFIILKESLKYIPVIGPGMMFYGFIFLARKWATDKPRFEHRLQKLKSSHSGPLSGSRGLDPMWLMIFPEGTNLSFNGRVSSAKWAEKQGMKDLKHQLLPRSTGLLFCLRELKGTVDWVYDCTVAYEGIPRGKYGQDIFTLPSTYFQGRPPKSVNMYWRRFAVSTIPIDDQKAFEQWVLDRWIEKDILLEQYLQNGRFPADDKGGIEDGELLTNGSGGKKEPRGAGYIETEVRPAHWYEIGQVFIVLSALGLVVNVLVKSWRLLFYG
ncbi:MAG: hypothetical protein M1813_004145 [Trichoglossum hirsutum]|nr:MAG: hypothetical protein M1813_004145 [Trichoglossum hirsutum]